MLLCIIRGWWENKWIDLLFARPNMYFHPSGIKKYDFSIRPKTTSFLSRIFTNANSSSETMNDDWKKRILIHCEIVSATFGMICLKIFDLI